MSNSCLPYQAPDLIAATFQASGIIATCINSHQNVSPLALTGGIEIFENLSGPTRRKFAMAPPGALGHTQRLFPKLRYGTKIYF